MIAKWLKRNQRASIPLIVAHSHAHGDHVSGDRQFVNLPDVEMVPLDPAGTAKFYRIENWPNGAGGIDLGDRVIDVIPIPGHEKSSVALYDRETGVLLTGDTLYPGRLYVPAADFATFTASVQRLVDFTEGKRITHILGTHIEQSTTPFVDYPIGSFYQPEEHALELGRAQLLELNQALLAMGTASRSACCCGISRSGRLRRKFARRWRIHFQDDRREAAATYVGPAEIARLKCRLDCADPR